MLTPLEEGVVSNTAYAFSEAFSDDPDLADNQASTSTPVVR